MHGVGDHKPTRRGPGMKSALKALALSPSKATEALSKAPRSRERAAVNKSQMPKGVEHRRSRDIRTAAFQHSPAGAMAIPGPREEDGPKCPEAHQGRGIQRVIRSRHFGYGLRGDGSFSLPLPRTEKAPDVKGRQEGVPTRTRRCACYAIARGNEGSRRPVASGAELSAPAAGFNCFLHEGDDVLLSYVFTSNG